MGSGEHLEIQLAKSKVMQVLGAGDGGGAPGKGPRWRLRAGSGERGHSPPTPQLSRRSILQPAPACRQTVTFVGKAPEETGW